MGLSIKTSHEHISLHCPVTGLKLSDFGVSRNKAYNKRFPINSNFHQSQPLGVYGFIRLPSSAQVPSMQHAEACVARRNMKGCCKDKFFFVNDKTNAVFLILYLAKTFRRNFASDRLYLCSPHGIKVGFRPPHILRGTCVHHRRRHR